MQRRVIEAHRGAQIMIGRLETGLSQRSVEVSQAERRERTLFTESRREDEPNSRVELSRWPMDGDTSRHVVLCLPRVRQMAVKSQKCSSRVGAAQLGRDL